MYNSVLHLTMQSDIVTIVQITATSVCQSALDYCSTIHYCRCSIVALMLERGPGLAPAPPVPALYQSLTSELGLVKHTTNIRYPMEVP